MSETTPYSKFAVLYVDDEEQALKYFQKGLGREFQVLTANSVDAALEILNRESHRIGVVLTDQKMPRRCGTELLAEVRTRWPNIVRMLVTAYSEIDNAIEAVNGGSIYKYLTKPVDFSKLREALKSSFDRFLAEGERDSLLQIKMSSLRRMVVEDRVRSLNNFTFGLTHHLRNSMTAMGCFLEEVDPANRPVAVGAGGGGGELPEGDACADEMWKLAVDERDRLLRMLEAFQQAVVEPTCTLNDELSAEDLLTRGTTELVASMPTNALLVVAKPGLGQMKVDAARMAQLMKILINYVATHNNPDGKVTVSLEAAPPVHETPAVQIRVTGHGLPWTDRDVATFFTPFAFPKGAPSEVGQGLLSAFSIAQQHGGDIVVHRTAPLGPGFEVFLPMNPENVKRPAIEENLLKTIFT